MYHVEIYREQLGWRKYPFAEHRIMAYCDGFVDAFDGMYPSDPMRIIKTEKDGTTKVIRETRGRSKVKTS